MIPVLLFPQFDPVLIQLGPLAIRWYALAYIGSLLLGWRIMRRLVQRSPAVATPEQTDDFLTWATLGVVLGGRLGYVLFYQPGRFLAEPATIFAVWQGGMSFHGGALGRGRRAVLYCWTHGIPLLGLRRPHRRRHPDRARAGPGRQLHQRRAMGPPGAGLAALGHDLPPGRPRAAPPQPALPGPDGGAAAVHPAVAAGPA